MQPEPTANGQPCLSQRPAAGPLKLLVICIYHRATTGPLSVPPCPFGAPQRVKLWTKWAIFRKKRRGGRRKKQAQSFFTFVTAPCAGGQLQSFKELELDVNATGRARASPALLVRHSGWIYGQNGRYLGGERSPGFFTMVACLCAGGQLQGFKELEVACKCHGAGTGPLLASQALLVRHSG